MVRGCILSWAIIPGLDNSHDCAPLKLLASSIRHVLSIHGSGMNCTRGTSWRL